MLEIFESETGLAWQSGGINEPSEIDDRVSEHDPHDADAGPPFVGCDGRFVKLDQIRFVDDQNEQDGVKAHHGYPGIRRYANETRSSTELRKLTGRK